MTGRQLASYHLTCVSRLWRRATMFTFSAGLAAGTTGFAQVTTKGGGPLAPVPMSTSALDALGKPKVGLPVAAKAWAGPVPTRPPADPFANSPVVPVQFKPEAVTASPVKPIDHAPVKPIDFATVKPVDAVTAKAPAATTPAAPTAPKTTPTPLPPSTLPMVTPGQLAATPPAYKAPAPVTRPRPEPVATLSQKGLGNQPVAPVKADAAVRVVPPVADPVLPFNTVAMQPVPAPMRVPGNEQPAPVAPRPMGPAAPAGPARPAVPLPAEAQLPQPRPLFPEDKVRLNRMGGPVGTTPVPTAKDLEEIGQFVDGVVDPKNTLDVIEGRARLVLLKKVPTQIQVVDPTLISSNQLNDPKQFSILGRRTGTTVLNLWFTDPADPNKEVIISYLVRVLPDPEAKARLERVYKALEEEINRFFPNSRVRLRLVGDKLMVSGQAHDTYDATEILRIVRSNAPDGGGGGGGSAGQAQRANVLNVGAAPGNPLDPTNPTGTPGQESYLLEANPNVINNLRIPGEQQVNLRVTVAEVNRAAARSIGVNFSVINNQGINVFGQFTGGLFGAGNLVTALDNGQIPIAINALRTLNYARSLAEPNLTAMNGQTATFLAGGQFPVPVLGGIGGGGLQGVQFVPFGVQLLFTPFITDRDRIRLTMNATVSTRNNNGGANIGGANVPGLNARTFSTTVEMREGQTMAVAGLIENDLGADSQRVPFLGDLPFVGRLLGLDRITSGEQELVILVTPELVHPLNQNELTPLPGSDIFEPGDLEFYLKGRLESRRSYDYRSAVRTDIDRMLSYRRCEQQFITGPTGHTEGVFNRPVTAPAAGK